MITKLSPYLFSLFWICLIFSTYMKISNVYIVVFIGIVLIQMFLSKDRNLRFKFKVSWWKIFVSYYLLISVIGLITGYVGAKNLLEFFIKYICFPAIIIRIIPKSEEGMQQTLLVLKNVIFFAVIYGFIESIIKYNPLADIIMIENKSWIIDMNNSNNYQCSSLFLHYNYYGCVLITGWIIATVYPYKNKGIDIIYKLLIIQQILACQSRICWIAFAFLLLVRILKNKRNISRKIQIFLASSIVAVTILILNPEILSFLGNFITTRFSRLWEYGFQDGSLGQRVGTLMNWPTYFYENPIKGIFGTGYQSINAYYMKVYSYFKGFSTADCEWTVFLVETGLIGIMFFIFAIIKDLIRPSNGSKINELKKYAIIVFLIEAVTLDLAANNIILTLIYLFLLQGYYKENSNSKNMINYNERGYNKDE